MESPWVALRTWTAWRGLQENLEELERLLRQIGGLGDASAYALDLADQIAAVLDDPVTARDLAPADYRLCCPLAKAPRPSTDEDEELESVLTGWLADLARYLADVPVLLESPPAAQRLGGVLTQELPRVWQGRFGALLFRLRQLVRSGAGRKGGLPAEPAPRHVAATAAALAEHGWWQPQYVLPGADGCQIVLPEAPAPAELAAVQAELLYLILRDAGPDAARLHLLLLGRAADTLPEAAVVGALGPAPGARGRSRREQTARAYAALDRLRRIQLSVLSYQPDGDAFSYVRRSAPLWELKVDEFGQALLVERDGALATHGEDWAVQVGAGSWERAGAPLPAELAAMRDPLSLATAVALLLAGRPGDTGPVTVEHQAVLTLAGIKSGLTDREAMGRLWHGLRAAVRRQAEWGWQADTSAWPAELRRCFARRSPEEAEPVPPEDWAAFLAGSTTFQREMQ